MVLLCIQKQTLFISLDSRNRRPIQRHIPLTIAKHIETDLIDKIRNDDIQSDKLTLSSLADEYQVSLTPVRVALERLIEDNFILKGNNGRLRINNRRKSKQRSKTRSKKRRLPSPDWDKTITEDIIQLSIRGDSVYLREEPSAQKYGVGRTVIRQVFNRLAGSGLIEHVPRRGWLIHPFREQDMLDYIEMRETLELKALQLARKQLDPVVLEQFIQLNSPDEDGTPQLNNKLHSYWIEQSGNRYIQSFFNQFGVYYNYLFNYSTVATSVTEEKAAEHRRILRALLRKDWEPAYKALRRHIRAQRPNVTHMFEQFAVNSKKTRKDIQPLL